MLAVLLIAFALRVADLGRQELRGDEAFGYFFVQQGYADIVAATIDLQEPHPVASYFLLKGWLGVAGPSEFALRFPSLFFGVLGVALVARLARRLELHPRVGVVAALLMAMSPYAIWHSQDARMYAMSLALNTALVILAVEALTRRRWPWVLAYIATALLALHTHYFSVLTLAALTLFLVARAVVTPPARAALRDWLIWNFGVLLLFLPWLLRAGDTLSQYGGNGDSPSLVQMLIRSFSVFAAGESVPGEFRPWIAGLALFLMTLGAARLWLSGGTRRRSLGLLACLFLAPLFLAWYGSWNRPIFNERYLVNAVPAFTLLVAAVVQPLPARRRALDVAATLLLIVFVAAGLYSQWNVWVQPEYTKTRGWRELAAALTDSAIGVDSGKVRLAQSFPDPTLWYYTTRLRPDLDHLVLPPAANDSAAAAREVERLVDAGVTRVALAVQPSPNWDAAGIAQSALASEYDLAGAWPLGGWQVELWSRMSPSQTGATMPLASFGAAIDLAAAEVSPTTLHPGSTLVTTLLWRNRSSTPRDSVAATVQLLGPDGSVVAQQDRPLPTGDQTEDVRAAYAILLPDALAAGDYQLIAALYDAAKDGLPRLHTQDGADSVTLARWSLP